MVMPNALSVETIGIPSPAGAMAVTVTAAVAAALFLILLAAFVMKSRVVAVAAFIGGAVLVGALGLLAVEYGIDGVRTPNPGSANDH